MRAHLGINYDYAREIIQKYNQLGEVGVKNGKRNLQKGKRGKKELLKPEQFQKLALELAERPFDGGIWTGPKVARWIERETGVEKVWNQRGWDYLKKLNYSWPSPRPQLQKSSLIEQEKFRKNLPLKVKEIEKKYPSVEIDLWFFDEHRVGGKPILRKVWNQVGQRLRAYVNHRYEWLYVYGFVKPKTGETRWYLIPRVNTLWLNVVYKQFAEDVGVSDQKKSY